VNCVRLGPLSGPKRTWFGQAVPDMRGGTLQLGLYGSAFGAAIGSLIGLLAHWLTRGRRDFESVRSMRADRYDVLADADVADDARRLLT
jgi:NhaP-type Na+/H+ or K+/H+ antiporter